MVGKRNVCGNPLWLEWAKQIQQEVEDKDKGDTGYANKTYARASKSIAACPIPYSNLNELLSLQYVGKVMLSRLMKKQKEYYLARGMEIPANGGGGLEVSADGGGSDEQPAGDSLSESRPRARGKAAVAGAEGDSDEDEASDSSFNMRLQAGGGSKRAAELEARRVKRQRLAEAGEDSDTAISRALIERQAQKKGRGGGAGAAKKTPAPRVKKAYVPEKASGAYALLVGLLLRLPDHLQQPLPPLNSTDQEAEDVREDHIIQHLMANQLTKSDLMNEASEHCRVSMHTSENGRFHTGWTSMKTLLTRELVVKKGNPARFHLTREGYTCALGVWTAANAESGGFPAVSVPIEAMGGFRYALPQQQSSQAGPGPSTLANTASRAAAAARSSMTTGQSGSRGRHAADNAYTTIIDDMDIQDDFPAFYDGAPAGHGGGASKPSLESRTAEGLQFWYISPEGDRVKNRHEAALEPLSAGLTGTMVQVEISAKDLGHPVARRYQGWVQSRGLFFRGYIFEDTAPEICAGIGGANMDTPDLARSNGRGASSLGIRNHSGGLSDLGSSPVPPTRHHEQSLNDSRRAQLSRSATDGFQTDETLLLEDLFGTKKKKKTTDMAVQRSGDSSARTTSLPASIPLPYIRGRRELGKRAPVITVSRSSMLPRREDKTASGSGGSGNPRDVLNAYSAGREASRKVSAPVEPKPTDELDFSPVPGPLFNTRNPSFTPEPARALASSPTPAFDDEFGDIGSPPMIVDDIDTSVAMNIPQAPLFLPDDVSNPASRRPPSRSVNSRPPNGSSVRSAPITVPITRVNSAVPVDAEEEFAFEPKDAIVYEPGTYDIILVIDGREVKNKRDEDTLRKELSDKGIQIEVKALNLGDMLWIARSRLSTLGGEDKECVLDYVVERKRLDDLCISIRDGRYDEQKFRLNNSCLRNVYYIVEQWNIGSYLGNPDSGNTTAQAVATARSQTQVTDGFFVKDTHKLGETIEYLRLLTEVIVETHQNAPIHVVPSRYIARSSYSSFQTHLRKQHPATPFYTTYEAFQELNTKAANRTLRETFARMLLCVKQMSSERVSASLNHWQTPRELHEWLKAQRIEAEAQEAQEAESAPLPGPPAKSKGKKKQVRGVEMVFADTVQGEGRAKIGDQMSRDLYKIFG